MTKILCIGEQNLEQITSEYDVVSISATRSDFNFSIEYAAIVINVAKESLFIQWLEHIRANEINFASLVFTNNSHFSEFAMVDGLLPKRIDIDIERYLSRKKELNLNTNDNLENKLLSYLWLCESRTLRPSKIIDNGVSYQYPFLELWDDGQGKEYWLNRMVKSGNLVQEQLIDRIRQCKSCSSSLLNYVDCCGDCGSIDLKLEQALHCFACGHVGEQKSFIRSGEMVCPNCINTLRHIGTDYDRPIENKRCNGCNNLFIDAKVSAQCFTCSHNNEIDDLIQKEYFSFAIGHNGIIKIKTGSEPQQLAMAVGEAVPSEHFSWMVQWLNKMALRQNDNHLFLGLRYSNLELLTETMSTVSLTSRLEAFSERLKSVLRTTDIICQPNSDSLYFLLPNVTEQGMEVVKTKLSDIASEQEDNPLEIKVTFKLLPDTTLNSDIEQWLTERNQELVS